MTVQKKLLLHFLKIYKSDYTNLTAFVCPGTSSSVGVGKVNMAASSSHDILDVITSLANDVRMLRVTNLHLESCS